jgi:transposase
MIQITPQTRILLSIRAVDFRKGIDGLAGVCRAHLQQDPLSGCMFVFCNRRKTALKILFYDGQGFWLCLKRLSKGRLNWWPTESESKSKAILPLAVYQLQLLFWNGDLRQVGHPYQWKPLTPL